MPALLDADDLLGRTKPDERTIILYVSLLWKAIYDKRYQPIESRDFDQPKKLQVGLYSCGLYSYGLYSYGLYSYGRLRPAQEAAGGPKLPHCLQVWMRADAGPKPSWALDYTYGLCSYGRSGAEAIAGY